MPTIAVKRDALFAALGETYYDEEFQDLCFKFGLELDEVTTEKQMMMKEQGQQAGVGTSEEILYRIDIPANRYDLLCLEGLVNGILVFQGKMSPPLYRLSHSEDHHSLHLTPATGQIRPYAVAAVLKNVTFTKESYNSFIELQDKLHQNICRKRTLVAIGTHDLDTIQGPFVYDALPPHQIKFKALNQQKEMTAPELMDLYSSHAQLKQYLGIISSSPVYPVIKDKNGVVLSMPPIINGDHSKITLDTKNVFIECTATDLTKAIVVLDTIVCMFSVYCGTQYEIQPCKVYAPDGTYQLYPTLEYRDEVINIEKANNYIGIKEDGDAMASLLSRMCLSAVPDGDAVRVRVPPTRHDVIHACDLYEDIAIAYGYNNIELRQMAVATCGGQVPLNKLTEQLRMECAHAGFTEALTFTLCSREDISTKLGKNIESVPAVHISNPKTLEFQVVRTNLLSGLLKTIAANKKMPLPLKLFEISDVVVRDDQAETGARNERRLCALHSGRAAGFQYVHGLLDRVMLLLGQPWDVQRGYALRQCEDYMDSLCKDHFLQRQYRKLDGGVLWSRNERNLDCIVTFQTHSILQRFMLHFDLLQLDCNDHLYVYDGAHDTAPPKVDLSCRNTKQQVGALFTRSNFVTLKYVTDNWGTDANGFKLVITSVKDPKHGCKQFRCKQREFCVSADLMCDGVDHCADGSDEDTAALCPESGGGGALGAWAVVGGASGALLLLAGGAACCACRRRGTTRDRLQLQQMVSSNGSGLKAGAGAGAGGAEYCAGDGGLTRLPGNWTPPAGREGGLRPSPRRRRAPATA